MNRLLAISVAILTFGLLGYQQFFITGKISKITSSVVSIEKTNLYRIQGNVEQLLSEGDVLKRGEVIKTTDGFALIQLNDTKIALSERTEIQLVREQEDGTAEIKLIGGRIVSSGPVFVTTPWITTWSDEPLSVVNYSFDTRAQILPMGASAYVDNDTLPNTRIILPIEWVENDQSFTTDSKPFDPSTSAETRFYEWFQNHLSTTLIK